MGIPGEVLFTDSTGVLLDCKVPYLETNQALLGCEFYLLNVGGIYGGGLCEPAFLAGLTLWNHEEMVVSYA